MLLVTSSTKSGNLTSGKSHKIRLFTVTVESVLLYGSETWTFDTKLTRILDGSYIRMLIVADGLKCEQNTSTGIRS